MTQIPVALVKREHNEAIARLDPAQVRAVRRLIKAASSGNLHRSGLLTAQIEGEAARPPSPLDGVFPDWWTL